MTSGELGVAIRPPGGCNQTIGSGIIAASNTWYHIAGTCDGAIARIYVNGQLRASGASEPGYVGTTSGARIGGEACCSSGYFPGLVDEAAIYTRALTAGEIAAIYNAGAAGKCSGAAAPVIFAQPQSVTNFIGGTAGFSVVVDGTPPLAYQWQVYGANLSDNLRISGSHTNILTITNAQLADAGSYSVTITNLSGPAVSSNALLTIVPPPSANWNIYRGYGGSTDGTPFPGYPVLQGTVTCVPSIYSANASLMAATPSGNEANILWFPLGNNVDFSVGMSGAFWAPWAATYTFGTYSDDGSRLYVDGILVVDNAGSHGPQTRLATTALSVGLHYFTVNFFECCGGDANLTAYLDNRLTGQIEGPPVIISQPVAAVAALGGFGSLRALAAGTQPLTYQWLFNGTNLADNARISGSQTNVLSITDAHFADAGTYSVAVSNSLGYAFSSNAVLSVTTNITWTGAVSSDWFNPTNWTPAAVPGPNYTMTFSSGTINFSAPVTLDGQFNWSGGTLTGSPLTIGSNAVLNINGSVALGCGLTNAGTVNWTAGNVLMYNQNPASLYPVVNLAGGLWNIRCDASLYLNWGYTNTIFQNAGTVQKSANSGQTSISIPFANSGTLLCTAGTLSLSGGLANTGLISALNSAFTLTGAWTNNGSITSSNATVNLGGTFTLAQLGNFSRIGGALYLNGTLNNTNTTLTLDGPNGSWILYNGTVLGGTIVTSNGAALVAYSSGTLDGVTLNGTLDVGNTINGGWLNITDGLTLNGTMRVGNPTNGWYGYVNFTQTESLSGNATVNFGNSGCCNALRLPNGGTTLTLGPNVVVQGQSGQIGSSPCCFGGPQNVAVVNQGLIAANVNGGTIMVNGAPVLNSGSMLMANGGSLNINYLTNVTGLTAGGGGTLTLNGNWTLSEPLTLLGSALSLSGNWTNNSQITVANASLNLSGNWTNGGSITAENATVTLGGTFTIAQLGNFNRVGGTVTLSGTLNNTNTTLTLDGPYSSWILYNGAIRGGTVVTTNGASLIANSSGTLDGVTLNGTLDAGNSINGGWLYVTDGLTLNGTMLVGNPSNGWYGYVNFTQTETLGGNATVNFGNSGCCNALRLVNGGTTLTLGPNVVVQGHSGQIGSSPCCFGGPQNVGVVNQGLIAANVNGGTIMINGAPVLNPGSILMANGGSLNINYLTNFTGLSATGAGTLTFNGNYNVSPPLTILNSTLVFNGNYNVSAPLTVLNSTVTFNGNWTNSSIISVTNSTVNLAGTFSLNQVGTFNRSGGTVNLTGTLNNTNTTLTLDGPGSSWVLYNGAIRGGTLLATNGASLIANSSGTLDGVTVNGTLDVGNSINGGWLYIQNGLTLNGTMLVGNPTNGWYGYVNFTQTETLSGNATVNFGNSGCCNALRLVNGSTMLTLGPNVVVQGHSGQVGSSPCCFGGPQNVVVLNQGLILANVNGGTIAVNGAPVLNPGAMLMVSGGSLNINYLTNVTGLAASGGGTLTLNGNYNITTPLTLLNSTLTLNGNWTNASTINVTNTTVNLGGAFTLANLGTFNRGNGTVNLTGILNNTNTTLTLDGTNNS
jgi:hypothetical protein